MTIDAGYVDWLRSAGLYTSAEDSAIVARWGDRAIESEIMTPLALKTGADAEAARQLALFSGPLVIDDHIVPGLRRDLHMQVVTLTIDALGYDGGQPCFVLRTDESESVAQTTLTVLRRL